MTYSLALQERHDSAIREHFFSVPVERERAAFLIFGRAKTESAGGFQTLLLKEVHLLRDSDVDSSSRHITWSNDLIIPLLKRSLQSGLVVGIAHSHLNYPPSFSDQDDRGESDLHQLVRNRNGSDATLISLVFSSLGGIGARVWDSDKRHRTISDIRLIGNRYIFEGDRFSSDSSPELARQALAFGDHLNKTISGMRFSLVGCGGTGSAVAMLLARLGARHIQLIDPDLVETTNLNRLHGATHEDALQRRAKVDVVARHIREISGASQVSTWQASVTDERCWDELKSADVIFGCTDDNRGRMLLNRFAYFYVIPVIDLGLAIEVSREAPFRILALDGRITCVGPGETCLICRGIVDAQRAREESLRANDPDEYERQKKEAYVLGEGNPSPSVVTFTTEVAAMALNELIHRLHGFRGLNGSTSSRTRQFHRNHDLRPGDLPSEDCPICANDYYWARGDVVPFLDQVW
jgi:molybdopterin/thiamine biosynthesis adenylyltransferase